MYDQLPPESHQEAVADIAARLAAETREEPTVNTAFTYDELALKAIYNVAGATTQEQAQVTNGLRHNALDGVDQRPEEPIHAIPTQTRRSIASK